MVSLFLNVGLLFFILCDVILDKDQQRWCAAMLVLQLWLKVIDWLRLFDATAFYISLITSTIYSIRHFMIIMGVWYMTFGTAFYMLSLSDEKEIVPTISGVGFIDSFESMYELGLGEFSTDGYGSDSGSGYYLCYTLFLMATFLIMIVFLNMLIAIMGDAFDRASENKDVDARRTKLQIRIEQGVFMEDSPTTEDDEDSSFNKFFKNLCNNK